MQGAGAPPITVKEARKILGKDAKALTDDQVSEVITSLTLIAKKYLSKTGSKKKLGVLRSEQEK